MTLRLGAWNVRTLNDQDDGVGKIEQLEQDLDIYKIDLCCVSELKGCGEICSGNWKLIHI